MAAFSYYYSNINDQWTHARAYHQILPAFIFFKKIASYEIRIKYPTNIYKIEKKRNSKKLHNIAVLAILSDQTHLKTKQNKTSHFLKEFDITYSFPAFPFLLLCILVKKIWGKCGLNSSPISFSERQCPYLFSSESDILNIQIIYLHNFPGDMKIILPFMQRNMCIFLRFLEIIKILILLMV